VGEGDATTGGTATGHDAGGPSGALGSGRSVRRRVWGSGCEGWRNILGHDGVLEAVPILLGAAIGHATVLHDPHRVTSAAIGHATVLLCIPPVCNVLLCIPPVCNVLLCIPPVCNVLLCILIGLERVGMPRRRVRRHLRCHGVRQRGVEGT